MPQDSRVFPDLLLTLLSGKLVLPVHSYSVNIFNLWLKYFNTSIVKYLGNIKYVYILIIHVCFLTSYHQGGEERLTLPFILFKCFSEHLENNNFLL